MTFLSHLFRKSYHLSKRLAFFGLTNFAISILFFGPTTKINADEPVATSFVQIWSGYRYEEGVQQRIVQEYWGRWRTFKTLSIDTLIKYSQQQQLGLSTLGLGVRWTPWQNGRLSFYFAYQHERWPDWTMVENSFQSLVDFRLSNRILIRAGLGYRIPNYTPSMNWADSFRMTSTLSEFNTILRADFTLLRLGFFSLSAALGNYDRMVMWTFDHYHLFLNPEMALGKSWHISFTAGSALKGISGLILTANEWFIGGGISYVFP